MTTLKQPREGRRTGDDTVEADLALIAPVVKAAKLKSLNLTAIEARLLTPPEQLVEMAVKNKVAVEYATEVSYEHSPSTNALVVRATCRLSLTGPPTRQHCEISVTYNVLYALPGSFGDRELGAFANLNAVHNVWPFFREAVHSTMCHMGLPPYSLPLRKVVPTGSRTGKTD